MNDATEEAAKNAELEMGAMRARAREDRRVANEKCDALTMLELYVKLYGHIVELDAVTHNIKAFLKRMNDDGD